eukprot:545292_1
MSLEKVIQFNVLIGTLNEEEFDLFFSEFTTLYGKRETITKSIFHLLVHENKHNINAYESNANRIITNIIDNRKLDDQSIDEQDPSTPTFNAIPAIMVSECASYLHLSEVTNFSLCNRHSYISCKSIPTSITSMDMLNASWFNDYCYNYGSQYESNQIQKFLQFRKVKYLGLETNSLQFVPLHQWHCFHLDTLSLSDIQLSPLSDNLTVLQNVIKQINATHLYVDTMQPLQLTMQQLFTLVCLNKNIEYLTLRDLHIYDYNPAASAAVVLTVPEISESNVLVPFSSLSKLKGIALIENDGCQDLEWRFIVGNHLSKQLQSLHVHLTNCGYHKSTLACVHSWKGHDYSNLQELCLSGINTDQIIDIVQTATQLKRFHFTHHPLYGSNDGIVSDQNRELLKTVLLRKNIEYLSITTASLLGSIIQIVFVLTNKDCKIPTRKCFKLRLKSMNEPDADIESNQRLLAMKLRWQAEFKPLMALRISLETLVTKDFMFFIQFRLDSTFGERIHNEMEIMRQKEEKNYHMYSSTKTLSVSYYEDGDKIEDVFEQITFALCNKKNSMGGYKYTELWNMPCTFLDDIA